MIRAVLVLTLSALLVACAGNEPSQASPGLRTFTIEQIVELNNNTEPYNASQSTITERIVTGVAPRVETDIVGANVQVSKDSAQMMAVTTVDRTDQGIKRATARTETYVTGQELFARGADGVSTEYRASAGEQRKQLDLRASTVEKLAHASDVSIVKGDEDYTVHFTLPVQYLASLERNEPPTQENTLVLDQNGDFRESTIFIRATFSANDFVITTTRSEVTEFRHASLEVIEAPAWIQSIRPLP